MLLHQTNGLHARAQALPVREYPHNAPVVYGIMLAVLVLGMTGCAERKKPPLIRAEITNVYHETTILDDFTLIYWWEERGETPFLKPHTLQVRECIVETMVPLPDRPDRVSVLTERIPFERIATIAVVLTEAGKKIEIQTRDGTRIEATSGFPRTLRRDPKSGIADHKVFVAGSIAGAEKRKEFKQELNYIRQIRILEPPSPQ
jgi:hypothetical protein